jgi:hypothetical protein
MTYTEELLLKADEVIPRVTLKILMMTPMQKS